MTASRTWTESAALREALACPVCLSPALRPETDPRLPSFLLCSDCGAVFPIEDETPHLIDLRGLLRLPLDALAAWHLTQMRASPLYESNDSASCSLIDRDDVQAFRRFMNLSGKRVLDVGSGSFALPGYADGSGLYADGRGFSEFVGLDPIPPAGPPVFPLVVAIGERLPFRDASFDAVILATSLDHALDISTTLSEIRRVLTPRGAVYLWAMFVDEERAGAGADTPVLARVQEPRFDLEDPVGAYLDGRRSYDAATEAVEADRDGFETALVDAFHFRHLVRGEVMRAFVRERFSVAAEETYISAIGGHHSFLRFVKASPEQVIAQELALELKLEAERSRPAEEAAAARQLEQHLELVGRLDAMMQRGLEYHGELTMRLDAAMQEARERQAQLTARLDALTAELSALSASVASLAASAAAPSGLRRIGSRMRSVAYRPAHAARGVVSRAEANLPRAKHVVRMTRLPVGAAVARRTRRTGGKRILMLTISQIRVDPRINKVAKSLADGGFEVDILAYSDDGVAKEIDAAPGVRYIMVPRDGTKPFLLYQEELHDAAGSLSFDYVHANDLTTLGLAGLLARSRGVPLVYDAHEFWTENVEFNGREWAPMPPLRRRLAVRWEQWFLRYADIFVTIGPSLAAEFERRYKLERPPLLLANYPSLALLEQPKPLSIREECGLDQDAFVTLYMGGVNSLRNIEAVIRAHRFLPKRHAFVVMGPSVELFTEEYKALAAEEGVADRVFFLPPVAMNEVVRVAAEADCGIVMLRNICNNFYWFFPNKLFEYALAGIPVAASDFPDVKEFIETERCGVTFDADSPRSIADALRRLAEDPAEARAMGERGRASILAGRNWESAAAQLLAAYRSLAA